MKKCRDSYWDNLKLLLIFLVVLGHFLLPVLNEGRGIEAVFYWIYLFHMPAFVFVSGYFSKNYINKEYKEYKLTGYLALYIVFTVCIWIVEFLFKKKITWSSLLSTDGAPWYMLAMFFWYLIIPYISKLSMRIALPMSVILALCVGEYSACGNFLVLSRTIVFFPFFLLGFYFDGSLIRKIKPWMRFFSFIVLFGCGFFLFFYYSKLSSYLPIVDGSKSYLELEFTYSMGLVVRLCWYCISAIMIMALLCIIPTYRIRITYIGERTLGIYIIHRLLRDVFQYVGVYNYLGSGLQFLVVCVLISCLIVYLLSAKCLANFLNVFFRLDVIMNYSK